MFYVIFSKIFVVCIYIVSEIVMDVCSIIKNKELYYYRRPSGEDKEYFVQLFVEQDKNIIPSTQLLLCDMFLDQNISFVKVCKVLWCNQCDVL